MVVNKRKKNTRQRGNNSHGWGAKKKHRGAGNRGGRGMAGSGKRADQFKPTILKLYGNAYFGKRGFHRPQKMIQSFKSLNLDELEILLTSFLAEKKVVLEGERYLLNLEDCGYHRLLGRGSVHHKFKIRAVHFSSRAGEKIRKAGGEVLNNESTD